MKTGVIILLALGGCASAEAWSKPDVSPEQSARDHRDCQRMATSSKRYSGPFFDRERFRLCMSERGYTVQPERRE